MNKSVCDNCIPKCIMVSLEKPNYQNNFDQFFLFFFLYPIMLLDTYMCAWNDYSHNFVNYC